MVINARSHTCHITIHQCDLPCSRHEQVYIEPLAGCTVGINIKPVYKGVANSPKMVESEP